MHPEWDALRIIVLGKAVGLLHLFAACAETSTDDSIATQVEVTARADCTGEATTLQIPNWRIGLSARLSMDCTPLSVTFIAGIQCRHHCIRADGNWKDVHNGGRKGRAPEGYHTQGGGRHFHMYRERHSHRQQVPGQSVLPADIQRGRPLATGHPCQQHVLSHYTCWHGWDRSVQVQAKSQTDTEHSWRA